MFDDFNKETFRLVPNAKSFHLIGCRWRDVPVLIVFLVLALSLLTGFNFVLSLLPRDALLVVLGISIGYFPGIWIGARRGRAQTLSGNGGGMPECPPLSDRVKEIARDPNRKIEAIKAYREESGAQLADATKIVEDYINRDR